ncbi:Transcription antitermination protein RfaH [Methylobacterium persicinum]|nr:Transcription antitermination protein RfaH [Methylobacterium persicinum]
MSETENPIRIWIAAHTAPNAEVAVRDALAALDYPVLLPTGMVEMVKHRQRMLVERPVFPRYLFVGIPHGASWYPIRAVTGVSGVISSAGEPRPVPDRAIHRLMAAVAADAFSKAAQPRFREGQPVRVDFGTAEIEAFVGRLLNTLPAQRIEVVFSALGKQHRATVSVDKVRAA